MYLQMYEHITHGVNRTHDDIGGSSVYSDTYFLIQPLGGAKVGHFKILHSSLFKCKSTELKKS